MARTNIDIDDGLIERVMRLYRLRTKREAVDYALRRLLGEQADVPAEGEGLSEDEWWLRHFVAVRGHAPDG